MINRTVIVGRLTAKPEPKKTNSGKSVTNITIACQRNRDEADFIPVVVWNQSADYLCQYGDKGALVAVDGRISVRKYTDNAGNQRTATEIIAEAVQLMNAKKEDLYDELPY